MTPQSSISPTSNWTLHQITNWVNKWPLDWRMELLLPRWASILLFDAWIPWANFFCSSGCQKQLPSYRFGRRHEKLDFCRQNQNGRRVEIRRMFYRWAKCRRSCHWYCLPRSHGSFRFCVCHVLHACFWPGKNIWWTILFYFGCTVYLLPNQLQKLNGTLYIQISFVRLWKSDWSVLKHILLWSVRAFSIQKLEWVWKLGRGGNSHSELLFVIKKWKRKLQRVEKN